MPSGWVFPIGQSMVKGDNLIVVFRGTMYVRVHEADDQSTQTFARGNHARTHATIMCTRDITLPHNTSPHHFIHMRSYTRTYT